MTMILRENQQKFELYILSLWFLFFLIIVVTAEAPFCFGRNCQFIGYYELFSRNVVPLIAMLFVLMGIIFFYRFKYQIAGSKSLPVRIIKIQDINYEHLTFLTTYIIPLICFNLSSFRYLLALAILLIVIGIIYIKTDKFYVNPTLAILGFRIYQADIQTRTGDRTKIVLISMSKIVEGDSIDYQELDERIYFARRIK
jgi:hypothetical protein